MDLMIKFLYLREFKRPDSLGIFYSMLTQYLGFQRDNDEYKVMGLSAYGTSNAVKNYDFSWLLSCNNKDCGNYSLNTDYLNVTENNRNPSKTRTTIFREILAKLNKPRRLADVPIDGYYKDIAKSAQEHLEKVALNLLEYLHEKTNSQNLCLAGVLL